MRVLLISVLGGYGYLSARKVKFTTSSYMPPLGLLYLGRSLEEAGHNVEILDLYNKEQLERSLTSVDAVGLSMTTASYKDAAKVATTIKEKKPTMPIIIGGPHCTYHPKKSLIEIPAADISVEGEADWVIKDVVKALDGTKKLSEICGIYYRKNNDIKSGKSPKIIKNLDSIPFPARHLVDKYDYGKMNNLYLFKPKFTSMITSRGCPFHCRFCTRHVETYKTYRQRSAKNVVKEIQEINEKYRSVMIVDDNFFTDKKRIHKIMDELIEIGTDIDLLVLGARVDLVDRELYKKMKKAGVTYLGFGIESGNQDVLDYYNKNITLDQIRKAVNLSREMNFITTGNFIFGAPIESQRHIEQTIEFACSLPFDIALFFPLFYKYGSDLWDEAVQNGIINENDGYSVIADSKKELGNFSSGELEMLCKDAFKRFYLRPGFIARQIYRSIMRKDFGILKIGLYNL